MAEAYLRVVLEAAVHPSIPVQWPLMWSCTKICAPYFCRTLNSASPCEYRFIFSRIPYLDDNVAGEHGHLRPHVHRLPPKVRHHPEVCEVQRPVQLEGAHAACKCHRHDGAAIHLLGQEGRAGDHDLVARLPIHLRRHLEACLTLIRGSGEAGPRRRLGTPVKLHLTGAHCQGLGAVHRQLRGLYVGMRHKSDARN
eukprot:9492182-Pyramimonas_sp.AAC.1